MECSINENNNSCIVCFPTCQETKLPVVFKNGMPHRRHKKQVSGLSPKEAALKTLAQSLNQRGLFSYSEVFCSFNCIFCHICEILFMRRDLVRKKKIGSIEVSQILFLCT